jgi:hypothetical protein
MIGDTGAHAVPLFAPAVRSCCDFRDVGISPSQMSTVGEAYFLDRLNKARKSHSVPFKPCLRWQYSNANVLKEE